MRILCSICDSGDPGATTSEITLVQKKPGLYECPNCGGEQMFLGGDQSVAEVVTTMILQDSFAMQRAFRSAEKALGSGDLALGDGSVEAEFVVGDPEEDADVG